MTRKESWNCNGPPGEAVRWCVLSRLAQTVADADADAGADAESSVSYVGRAGRRRRFESRSCRIDKNNAECSREYCRSGRKGLWVVARRTDWQAGRRLGWSLG